MIQVKGFHVHLFKDPEIYVNLMMVGEEGSVILSMHPRFEVDL